jgi:hypothetical protein
LNPNEKLRSNPVTQTLMKANRTPNSARSVGARNKVFRAEQQRRREEAGVRAAEYMQLTPQQKLERLDRRLGKGVGAVRERARIATVLAAPPKPPPGRAVAEAIVTEKPQVGAKKRGAKAGTGKQKVQANN